MHSWGPSWLTIELQQPISEYFWPTRTFAYDIIWKYCVEYWPCITKTDRWPLATDNQKHKRPTFWSHYTSGWFATSEISITLTLSLVIAFKKFCCTVHRCPSNESKFITKFHKHSMCKIIDRSSHLWIWMELMLSSSQHGGFQTTATMAAEKPLASYFGDLELFSRQNVPWP